MTDFDIKICMANGERIARIETMVKSIHDRKACDDCVNISGLARIKQNLKLINWIGAIFSGAVVTLVVRWAAVHPF